jgi:hypothetical protein
MNMDYQPSILSILKEHEKETKDEEKRMKEIDNLRKKRIERN